MRLLATPLEVREKFHNQFLAFVNCFALADAVSQSKKNYLKKLSKGTKFRWGVFRGARGDGFVGGAFLEGVDLEHKRRFTLSLNFHNQRVKY